MNTSFFYINFDEYNYYKFCQYFVTLHDKMLLNQQNVV